jgi:aldose 1-epimerase
VSVPVTGQQYQISAGPYRATVTELGAGLRELLLGDRPALLGYEADDLPPSGAGQLLVPWPNRIDRGRYAFGGAEFQLALTEPDRGNAIHGLTRWTGWTPVSHDASSVVLRSAPHGYQGYPFCVEIEAGYRLHPGSGLHVTITARNRGSGAAPYGTGMHPYLTVGTPSVDSCELTLPAASRLPTDDRGIPSGPPAAVDGTPFDFRRPRLIGVTKLDDALTGLDRDGEGRAWAHLADGGSGARVSLWAGDGYRWLQVFTGDPLGPDRRRKALAVEPMTCPPNAFVTGDDLLVLEPGQEVTHTWGIRASLPGRVRRNRPDLKCPYLKCADPGQVRWRVDVVGAARVAAFDEGDEVGVGPEKRPRPGVASGHLDHPGPVIARQQHGIARLTAVSGHRDRGPVLVGGDQPGDRLCPYQRLIGQRHYRRGYLDRKCRRRLEGGTERGAHAGAPFRVEYNTGSVELHRGGAGDDQDRVRAAGSQEAHAALGQGAAVQLHQRLGLAEPGPFTRAEQDARDRRAHDVQAYA